jgi:hypothetical protein
MSLSKLLYQRVVKVENQLAAAQNALDAKRPNVLKEVLDEAGQVLSPSMWDWILRTAEPPLKSDFIGRVASMLASDQGWQLNGGWREAPRYWWALRGCTFFYDKLKTEELFYFFRCSRAEFDSLPENVRNEAWTEAVRRLTALLRDPKACAFNKHRPDEARSLVVALSKCNLPQLLKPHLSIRTDCPNGSKEALAAWVNAEYVRQCAKRGHQPA